MQYAKHGKALLDEHTKKQKRQKRQAEQRATTRRDCTELDWTELDRARRAGSGTAACMVPISLDCVNGVNGVTGVLMLC